MWFQLLSNPGQGTIDYPNHHYPILFLPRGFGGTGGESLTRLEDRSGVDYLQPRL